MNKRIKELLKESTESRWYCGQEHDEVDQEKFAELIVKECAEIATMNQFQWDSAGGYVLKHFGVEE